MTRATNLRLNRKFNKDFPTKKSFKREEVKCPKCGKIYLISIGQIVRCKCVDKKYLPK